MLPDGIWNYVELPSPQFRTSPGVLFSSALSIAELMKFYRENNINPLGGCLPLLVQIPVFIILYNVLRGLTSLGANGTFAPKYISKSSKLYESLAGKTEMTKKDVAAVMAAIYELAVKEVKKNGIFVLGDFGRLVKAKRAARMGRNPATGEAIKIPAKTVVKAKIAKQLKDTVLPRK